MFLCLAVRKSHAEVEAMSRQSKGLAQEYDRLLREHHQLQVHNTNPDNTSSVYLHYLYQIPSVFNPQNLHGAEEKKEQ